METFIPYYNDSWLDLSDRKRNSSNYGIKLKFLIRIKCKFWEIRTRYRWLSFILLSLKLFKTNLKSLISLTFGEGWKSSKLTSD